jgi:hypothetical protein
MVQNTPSPTPPGLGTPEWFKASLNNKAGDYRITGVPPTLSERATQGVNTIVGFPNRVHNQWHTASKVVGGISRLSETPDVQTALGHVSHNLQAGLFQDVGALKPNVALIATLIHVLMRVKEAYISSNAPTTSLAEQQYNQEQSAMTYFREAIGVTIGFVFLKKLQGIFGKMLEQRLGFKKQSFGRVSTGASLKQGIGLLSGNLKPDSIIRMPDALPSQSVWKTTVANRPVHQRLAQIGYALEKWNDIHWIPTPRFFKRAYSMLAGKDVQHMLQKAANGECQQPQELANTLQRYELKGFNLVHKQLPVYLGTIPSVLLAGFGVEYASLHYSAKVKKYMLAAMRFLHVIPQEVSVGAVAVPATVASPSPQAKPTKPPKTV